MLAYSGKLPFFETDLSNRIELIYIYICKKTNKITPFKI